MGGAGAGKAKEGHLLRGKGARVPKTKKRWYILFVDRYGRIEGL